MNKKGVTIWTVSLIVLFLALIPFVNFMFHPRPTNLYITAAIIAVGAILHVIARKMPQKQKRLDNHISGVLRRIFLLHYYKNCDIIFSSLITEG